MKSTEYLDAVRSKLQLPSDYALAKVLGITREAVSALRNEKTSMGIETASKIGEILNIDGHVIYANGQIERAKTQEMRQFWAAITEKFSVGFESLISHATPRRIRTSAW